MERVFFKSFVHIDPLYYGEIHYVADINGDEVVSFKEAISYTEEMISPASKRVQTPFITFGERVPENLAFEDF